MRPALRRSVILAVGIATALVVAQPGLLGDYGQFVVASVAFYAMAVLAVSLLAGLSGIWSLGHTAFMAIGAYMAANLTGAGWPLEAIVPLAFVVSGAVGFVLGLSAGRFSILYFGLLTLALCMASNEVIGHWTSVTGGDEGIQVLPPYLLLAGGPLTLRGSVVTTVVLAAMAYLLADIVMSGRFGRRWLAVKSQRIAATAIGLRPDIQNALSLSVSAAIAAMAGIGIAFTLSYLDPVAFSLDAAVQLIVGTVVGGAGSLLGALVGAIFIVAVPELARGVSGLSVFVFGIATIGVLLFMREGIVPSLAARARRFGARRGATPASAVHDLDQDLIADLVRRTMTPATAALAIRDLRVEFGGIRALDGVALTVMPGSTVGLIGPNGAGKTTLLNVISGFYRASAGASVRYGDQDLLALTPDRRAAHGIGRTFQHAELFGELTLRESLVMAATLAGARSSGPRAGAGALADDILEGLRLSAHAHSFPAALPFGLRKVADIGRALAGGGSLVLMDEPFSGLDNQERGVIRAILSGMRSAGVSILIIDHAVQDILRLADRVVVLEFGRVLAEGAPDEIRTDPEVRRAYLGEPAPSGAAA